MTGCVKHSCRTSAQLLNVQAGIVYKTPAQCGSCLTPTPWACSTPNSGSTTSASPLPSTGCSPHASALARERVVVGRLTKAPATVHLRSGTPPPELIALLCSAQLIAGCSRRRQHAQRTGMALASRDGCRVPR